MLVWPTTPVTDKIPARWIREPLVHFLALGALLFLASSLWGSGATGSNRIVITPGQIDAMVVGYTRTWLRPPTEQELKGIVDEYVREEMAAREAMALGLDRDDTIIRRRLRQKLEFLTEDSVAAAPPTDAELQRWLTDHPDQFHIEPQVAFRQVYLSPERRGADIEDDARRLVARLQTTGATAAATPVGDSQMLPEVVERSTRTEVARQFGEAFADAVVALEPGRWAGPIRSGFGFHVVWVSERVEGAPRPLAEVRPAVEREFLAARRKQQLDAMYEELLRRYPVMVEPRAEDPSSSGTIPGSAR